MTDRELLEASAKAAGYELESEPASVWVVGEDSRSRVRRNEQGGHSIWNPLADDGDALRLAVKLGMEVLPQEPLGVLCVIRGASQARAKEPYGEDRNAATRRAIVRAAAAIGAAP